MSTYGERVRSLREAQGISGRALCKTVTISPAYLSDIEHGRRLPSPSVSDRIAATLGQDARGLWRLVVLERLSDRDKRALFGESFGWCCCIKGNDNRDVGCPIRFCPVHGDVLTGVVPASDGAITELHAALDTLDKATRGYLGGVPNKRPGPVLMAALVASREALYRTSATGGPVDLRPNTWHGETGPE